MKRLGRLLKFRFASLRGSEDGLSFGRSVLVIVTGTAAGQAITVAASPVLTRLYDPGEFGVLAVYVAILAVLTIAGSLSYEIAIPLPRSDRGAVGILVVAMIAVFIVTGLSALGVWIFRGQIGVWTDIPKIRSYLWLIPVGVLFTASYKVWNYWAIRMRDYPLIARTKVRQGLGSSGTQLGLGALGLGPVGLIVGQIVGQAAGITALIRGAFAGTPDFGRYVTRRNVMWATYRYRRFPILYSWSGLANALGLRLPLLAIAALHGAGAAGTLLLAERVVGTPMKLVGTAVGQVYFGRAAELVGVDMPSFHRLFRRLTWRLLAVGVLGVAFVAVGGPSLFAFVLGGEWGSVGTYVRVLGVMYVVQFAAGPMAQTLAVLEQQGAKLVWELMRLLAVASAFGLAWWRHLGVIETLALYAGLSTASLLVLLFITDTSLRKHS